MFRIWTFVGVMLVVFDRCYHQGRDFPRCPGRFSFDPCSDIDVTPVSGLFRRGAAATCLPGMTTDHVGSVYNRCLLLSGENLTHDRSASRMTGFVSTPDGGL